MQSKYLNSKLVINFEVDRNIISSNARDFENKLKSEFVTPLFVANGLPEGADPSIPRFFANSLGGHSKVEVAQNRISLTTNFDQNYWFEFDKIIKYLIDKFTFIKGNVGPDKVTFIGLVIQFDTDFAENEIIPYLKKLTSFTLLDSNIREFNYRYSKIYNDDFFVNITIARFEKITFNVPVANAMSGAPVILNKNDGKKEHGISVTIDMNTKPLVEKGARFDVNNLKSFFEPFNNLIKGNTLDDFVVGNLK